LHVRRVAADAPDAEKLGDLPAQKGRRTCRTWCVPRKAPRNTVKTEFTFETSEKGLDVTVACPRLENLLVALGKAETEQTALEQKLEGPLAAERTLQSRLKLNKSTLERYEKQLEDYKERARTSSTYASLAKSYQERIDRLNDVILKDSEAYIQLREKLQKVREPLTLCEKRVKDLTTRVERAKKTFQSVTAELIDPWELPVATLTPTLEQEAPAEVP